MAFSAVTLPVVYVWPAAVSFCSSGWRRERGFVPEHSAGPEAVEGEYGKQILATASLLPVRLFFLFFNFKRLLVMGKRESKGEKK